MLTLTRYNPFRELEGLPDGLLFGRFFDEPVAVRPWSPSVDIAESDNELILKADLPGVNEKEIEVKLDDGVLTLKGERKFDKESKEKGYHRIERGYGAFVRSFRLPETVDAEKVGASYRDGVLTVTLPKKEAAKPRTVKVAVN